MDPQTIERAVQFKPMARDADLPEDSVGDISGHATRVGATQDMVAEGVPMMAIMHAGRWKTETTVRGASGAPPPA